jgi:uncharacterized protein (DUF433 family)
MNERIVIDPKICHGKPVVKGTRTPVTVILDALAGGDTFETIQSEYDVTAEDIRASIAFASDAVTRQLAPRIQPGTGDWDAAVKAVRELEDYDFAAFRKQRDYDLQHAKDHLP